MLPLPVPDVVPSVSHDFDFAALQLSAPVPVFVIWMLSENVALLFTFVLCSSVTGDTERPG